MGTGIALGLMSQQASVFQAKEDQLVRQFQSPESLTDAKIDKGAKEFEAILLGNWLQQAEQSFATIPGADDDGDKDVASDSVMSFGVQAVSKSMADSGAFGISKMIAKALHAAADKADAGSSPQPGENK